MKNLLIFILLLSPFSLFSTENDGIDSGRWIFIGGDAGYSYQESSVATELDKQGFHLDLRLDLSQFWKKWALDSGVGIGFNYMEGEDRNAAVIKEDISSTLFFIELQPQRRLNKRWSLGPLFEVWLGDDIGLNTTGKQKIFDAYVGGRLSYLITSSTHPLRANLSVLTDISSKDRQNLIAKLGLQIGFPWEKSKKTKLISQKQNRSVGSFEKRKKDQLFSLNTGELIRFEFGKSTLSNQSILILQSLGEELNKKSDLFDLLIIEGHTDKSGSKELNDSLSLKRANSVRSALISGGLAGSKIRSVGYGSSSPISETASPKENRRVEIAFKKVKTPKELAAILKNTIDELSKLEKKAK